MNVLDLARAAVAASDAPRFRWLVLWPDGRSLEVCFSPELDRDGVEQRHPGGTASPLPDSPQDAATELRGRQA